jgi:hypothetical protein
VTQFSLADMVRRYGLLYDRELAQRAPRPEVPVAHTRATIE